MQTSFTFFGSTVFPVPICLMFLLFLSMFLDGFGFCCSIFTFFVRGVHFPFARVFQFAVAAFRAQVVEAVKRQHTDSVHPRSFCRIFLDPRLSVAPLAHFLLFFGCAGFSWFSMLLKCGGQPLQNGKHGQKKISTSTKS